MPRVSTAIRRNKEKIVDSLFTVGGLVLLVLVWDLSVRFTSVSLMLPPPGEIFRNIVETMSVKVGKATLWQHALISLSRVFVGYGIAAVFGIALALAMGRNRTIEAIVKPVFEMLRQIPALAWIPIAILWFGLGERSKYFIIFMAAFFFLVVTVYSGVKRMDNELSGVALMLGASKFQVYTHVILPASIPYIFAGLQYSLSVSWMAVLAAEMVSSTEGLGWMIIRGMQFGNTVTILTGMVAIGVIGMLLAQTMRLFERVINRWTERGN